MPKRHRRHSHHPVKKQIAAKTKAKPPAHVQQLGVSRTPVPWEPKTVQDLGLLVGVVMGGCVLLAVIIAKIHAAFDKSRQKAEARRGKEGKIWDNAIALRERAEVEEHMAESAARMLAARERVARASSSLHSATADSYAAHGTSAQNERLLASLLSGVSYTDISNLTPITSTRSIGSGTVDQTLVNRIVLQGVTANGADLKKSGVPSKWREWERGIRREHSALTAEAIIKGAKSKLGGSF